MLHITVQMFGVREWKEQSGNCPKPNQDTNHSKVNSLLKLVSKISLELHSTPTKFTENLENKSEEFYKTAANSGLF